MGKHGMQTCGDTYTSRSRCSWTGPPVDARRAAATTAARSREELRRGSHQSTTAYATAAAAKIKATATANAASVADAKPMAAYRLAAEGGPAPLPKGRPIVRHGHVEIVKHHHCAVAISHSATPSAQQNSAKGASFLRGVDLHSLSRSTPARILHTRCACSKEYGRVTSPRPLAPRGARSLLLPLESRLVVWLVWRIWGRGHR